jgi:hypothetical protein
MAKVELVFWVLDSIRNLNKKLLSYMWRMGISMEHIVQLEYLNITHWYVQSKINTRFLKNSFHKVKHMVNIQYYHHTFQRYTHIMVNLRLYFRYHSHNLNNNLKKDKLSMDRRMEHKHFHLSIILYFRYHNHNKQLVWNNIYKGEHKEYIRFR